MAIRTLTADEILLWSHLLRSGFQLQRATSDFQEKAALTRLFLPLDYVPEDSSLFMEGYLPTYKFST
jgi:hypothetical protein